MGKRDFIDEAMVNFLMEVDKKTIIETSGDYIADVPAFDQKMEKLKKELNFLAKAQEQQKKNNTLLEVAKRFEEALLKNTEKPVAMLKQLIGSSHTFALNKGLENLTREEIIEIIKDKNLIELLDKLNEE